MNSFERINHARKYIAETPEAKPLVAVVLLTLERMDNMTIAAAFNAITMFGRMQPSNHGFEALVESEILKAEGSPGYDLEVIIAALDIEIDRRVKAGTWQ